MVPSTHLHRKKQNLIFPALAFLHFWAGVPINISKRQCLRALLSNTGVFHSTAQDPQALDKVRATEVAWRELFPRFFSPRLQAHFQEQPSAGLVLWLRWANSQPAELDFSPRTSVAFVIHNWWSAANLVRKATSETRLWGFVFSSRLHFLKKQSSRFAWNIRLGYMARS